MKKTLMVFIVLGLLCSYNISFGEDVWKYKDNDGVIHITNVPDKENKHYVLNLKEYNTPQKQSSFSEKSSSDWVEYHRTEDGDVFLLNKTNITKSGGKYIVQVWVKWIYSDKEREDTLKMRRSIGFSTEGWSKLLYGIYLDQINCKNKKSRLLYINQYDEDSKLLFNGVYDEPKWEYIVPDSREDILRKKVCK